MPVDMSDDGCFKLGMSIARGPVKNVYDADDAQVRFSSVNAKIASFDDKTYEAWKNSETITFICPDCGNQVLGIAAQNIFECPSCKNKHAKAFVLEGEKYARELIIGHANTYLPRNAIPFKLGCEQAKQAISDSPDSAPLRTHAWL